MRSPSGRSAGLALACAVLAGALAAGDAAALPAGFVDELVTGGLSAPTAALPGVRGGAICITRDLPCGRWQCWEN